VAPAVYIDKCDTNLYHHFNSTSVPVDRGRYHVYVHVYVPCDCVCKCACMRDTSQKRDHEYCCRSTCVVVHGGVVWSSVERCVVAVCCCSVLLQRAAVCCSVLQCVAVWCNVE